MNSSPINVMIPFLACFLILAACKSNDQKEQKSDNFKPVEFEYLQVDDSGPKDPWAKIYGDIDNDGINDIIIGGRKGPLVWYKSPVWSKHKIVDGGYNTVDGEAADIDGDGDLDVIMGGIFWYENPGDLAGNPDQTWTTHLVADHPTHDIEIADLNMDGRLDIISRNQSEFGYKAGNKIHLWANNGEQPWQETVLICPHGEGILVSDLMVMEMLIL